MRLLSTAACPGIYPVCGPMQALHAPGTVSSVTEWWREAVLYQLYPRSYRDADGDGHGDLGGVLERLDHLEWLGVDAVWLNPTMPSPNADWGYDVADYLGVHPDLGGPAALEALIADAGRRGIRVLLDLVPNHTSEAHPWFADACSGRDAEHRGFYVWADPDPEDPARPPTNWQGVFGGSAWTWHEPTGQWYLHNFLPEQPDLNWWDPRVPAAFGEILTAWAARGVAGFRIDVAHALIHDRHLRDDPPDGAGGVAKRFSMNRPEGHDALRGLRRAADAAGDFLLLGETYVDTVAEVLRFYGDGTDELHLAFNVPFIHRELAAAPMRATVEAVEAGLPPGAWPVWTGSNHDDGRLTTRWADGDEARARCALVLLLTLRGTPVLYYGDELALPDVPVPPERVRDRAGGRDACRTPMPWSAAPGAGFTDAGAEPWLPLGGHAGRDVAAQRADPGSTLQLVRDLIALRRAEPELRTGAYATLPAPPGAWAWRRGTGWAVALNLGEAEVRVEGLAGTVAVATRRARDGERVAGPLALAPAEGVVVRLGWPDEVTA